MESRTDFILKKQEQASYDKYNRLENLKRYENGNYGTPTKTESMSYASNGNVNSKWDVTGTYVYGGKAASCATTDAVAGPHAVTSAGGSTYCYDKNGNMTSGANRTITWTTYDLPSKIVQGTNSVEFVYGPNRNRIQRKDVTASGTTLTKYSGAYERVKLPSGVIEERHYIAGVAVLTKLSNKLALKQNYMLKDHLGSIVAYVDVDKLASSYSSAVERSGFDAWGKRRQPNWAALTFTELVNYKSNASDRGYTGHEQVDSVGLIHMNGRVYDPVIGRFLSADPMIQAPSDLQSYNRYAYVRNNPLTLTDPSGFSWWSKHGQSLFKQIGLAIVTGGASLVVKATDKSLKEFGRFARKNKFVAEITQIAGCALAGPVGCVAVSSAVTYGVTDGDVKASVRAGAITGIQVGFSMGIAETFGHNPALTSLKGAGTALGEPGKGTMLQFAGRTTIAAIAGGVGSELSGGNFANGAQSAAMQHLFNAEGWASKIKDLPNTVKEQAGLDLIKSIGHWRGSLANNENVAVWAGLCFGNGDCSNSDLVQASMISAKLNTDLSGIGYNAQILATSNLGGRVLGSIGDGLSVAPVSGVGKLVINGVVDAISFANTSGGTTYEYNNAYVSCKVTGCSAVINVSGR